MPDVSSIPAQCRKLILILHLAFVCSLLKVGGRMTTVGLPDQPFSIAGFAFAGNSAAFGGSHLGKPVSSRPVP
jgi:hypothetical protein